MTGEGRAEKPEGMKKHLDISSIGKQKGQREGKVLRSLGAGVPQWKLEPQWPSRDRRLRDLPAGAEATEVIQSLEEKLLEAEAW